MTDDANQRGAETADHPDHFLAEWRSYRGYATQVELAMALDVSNSKISRIENGENELRPAFARKVARLFKIPLAALYTINPLGAGRMDAEMLDAIGEIATEDKPAALRMLRSLRRGASTEDAG